MPIAIKARSVIPMTADDHRPPLLCSVGWLRKRCLDMRRSQMPQGLSSATACPKVPRVKQILERGRALSGGMEIRAAPRARAKLRFPILAAAPDVPVALPDRDVHGRAIG